MRVTKNYLKSDFGIRIRGSLTKTRGPGKGWPKQKPVLTREDGEKILEQARAEEVRDWLVLRLIMQAGFKNGEIVGRDERGSRIQGIRLRDMADDTIWIQRLEAPRDVDPELIRQIRRFAIGKQLDDFVFEIHTTTVQKFTKNYARKARITEWRTVSPNELRSLLAPKVSQFRRELRIWFTDEIASAEGMADYYVANYSLENSIRSLIRETLGKHGKDWWENKVPIAIKSYVKNRQEAERDTPMSIRSSEPLDYTTFGHLSNIIEANWTDFEAKIRSRGVMRDILVELNELRAIIAHSCKLNDREKDRFSLRVRDWQAQQT